jgi:hypothetical protein
MTHDVGNPGPGLGESQKYGGLKWAVGSQTYYNVWCFISLGTYQIPYIAIINGITMGGVSYFIPYIAIINGITMGGVSYFMLLLSLGFKQSPPQKVVHTTLPTF